MNKRKQITCFKNFLLFIIKLYIFIKKKNSTKIQIIQQLLIKKKNYVLRTFFLAKTFNIYNVFYGPVDVL